MNKKVFLLFQKKLSVKDGFSRIIFVLLQTVIDDTTLYT